MALISRPGKEGNATTYQGKVAAGYLNILAQEVDADFDAIYSAWNQGVDTVNIKDGSVTAPKLAPGAVIGTSLAPGSVTNAALAANSVNSSNIVDGTIVGADIAPGTLTDSLIANVAWTKLIAPFVSQLTLATRGHLDASTGQVIDLFANHPADQGYDGSKPTWLIRLDYTNDDFLVARAPPPGTAFVAILNVTGAGLLVCTLANNSVNRNQLGVNAANGSAVTALSPSNFSVPTPNTWTTFVTMPSLTTRGGFVHLHANTNLNVNGPATGGVVYQRWLRDLTPLFNRSFNVSCTSAQQVVPLPGITWIDTSVPAGAHTYSYQVNVASGISVISSGVADGWFIAAEVG